MGVTRDPETPKQPAIPAPKSGSATSGRGGGVGEGQAVLIIQGKQLHLKISQ